MAVMAACVMRANFSRVGVLAAVLLMVRVTSGVAVASDLSRPPAAPSPNDCVAVYEGALSQQGTLTNYQAGAGIDCARPGNTAPYGASTAFTQSAAVQDGTPCTILYYAPVRFQNLPRYIHATWSSPLGAGGAANL